MTTASQQPKTYLQIASEWGVILGVAACVAVFATLFSIYKPVMMLLAIAGYVAVPVIAWRMLKSTALRTPQMPTASVLWRTGTLAFTAGALIAALAVFIVFKWVDPGFIGRLFDDVMKMYDALGTADAAGKAESLRQMMASGLPSPAQMAMQIFVFMVLSGSVLSIIVSAILRRRASRPTPPNF